MISLKKALTIAGSDTCGGAGMEADLKTFEEYGVYGTAALTCIVAQAPDTWEHHVFPVETAIVEKQIETVAEGVGIDAMKTGMLGTAALAELTARMIDRYHPAGVVIDPVMVCKGCDFVMNPEAAAAIRDLLVCRCTVVTPNTVEAAWLADMKEVRTLEQMKQAAEIIHRLGAPNVIIKGGERMNGDEALDLFSDGRSFTELASPKIIPSYNHGAGCTYSAAITAGLARGMSVPEAVRTAKAFITEALKNSFRLNSFIGCTNHPAAGRTLRRSLADEG